MTAKKEPADSDKKSPKPRLREGVLLRMRKRKEWRMRYLTAVMTVIKWPTGQAGRDAAILEAHKCCTKVRDWYYPPRRADLCIATIQRRAVREFKSYFSKESA